jgi:tetratricopeptide (TPR) repeat protein
LSTARIEELRKKFDENPRRYFAPLANEYRKAGDFDQAIFICQEYLPQQPGHMSGHIVFGQALFEARRLPEAKTVFETALSLDPENLIALRHLADISRDLGDVGAARTWYDRVLQADPRNEEIAAIVAQLGAAPAAPAAPDTVAAAAATTAEAPATPPPAVSRTLPDAVAAAAAAPTVELSADAVQEMLRARHAAKSPAKPEAQPEKLTLDTTPTVEIRAADADAGTMEGLEPTAHAGPMDLPAFEPLGLETNAAPGMHAEAPAAAPLDGLDTIPIDVSGLSAPAPAPTPAPEASAPPVADDGLLDLSSFSVGGESASAAAAPSPVETPIDGGHDSTDLIDLDFPAPPVTTPSEPTPTTPSSVPTMIIDAVQSVVPAVQGAVESAAPALMDFVETAVPSVVEAVKSTVEAVTETPTAIMEAIKAPSKEPPREAASTSRPSQQVPFVTETMAQLYLSQGHRAEAIDIYRKLIDARPGDAELKSRLKAIEDEIAAAQPAAAAAPPKAAPAQRKFAGSGPSIRVVLRELFGLDGAASFGAGAPSAGAPTEVGSIDLLFTAEPVAGPLGPLAVAFDGGYVAGQGTIDDLFSGAPR